MPCVLLNKSLIETKNKKIKIIHKDNKSIIHGNFG